MTWWHDVECSRAHVFVTPFLPTIIRDIEIAGQDLGAAAFQAESTGTGEKADNWHGEASSGPSQQLNGAASFSRQRGPYEPSWPPGPVWTLLNHSFFRGLRGYIKGQVGIDLFDWPWLVFAPVASTQAQRKPQPGRKAQSSKPLWPLWKASLVTSVTLHDETWLSQSCNIHQQIGWKATNHYQDDFTCSSLRKNWEGIQHPIQDIAKPSTFFTEKKCRLTNKLTEKP